MIKEDVKTIVELVHYKLLQDRLLATADVEIKPVKRAALPGMSSSLFFFLNVAELSIE